MKYSDLTALAIKISGIMLLVLVLSKLPEHIELIKSAQNTYADFSLVSIVMPFVIIVVFAVILILYPYKIANKLIVSSTDQIDPSQYNIIQIISIRLLGFLLLFWATSDLVYHFFIYFIYRDIVDASFGAGAYDYAAMFATVAEFIFAVLLIYKSKTISAYINAVGK